MCENISDENRKMRIIEKGRKLLIKTYKHLYEKIIVPDFIKECIHSASKGKRHRELVKRIMEDPEPVIEKIIQSLDNKTWNPPHHNKVSLREGSHRKQRIIQKPVFNNEQIVHHMIIDIMKPNFIKMFYEWSCGCIPGRGPLTAVKRICKWRDSYKGKVFYVAELDVKKFYQNVDTDILESQLKRIIKDDRYLEILFKIIDECKPGLPLGYYTSPWLGNLYLTPLDRYIIHNLHPQHYIRYVDNMFIIHDDKAKLHQMVADIMKYCADNLKLTIKEDWQIFQFENKGCGRAINCLGYVIHENRVTLRKSLLRRIRAKALRMHKKKRCRVIDAQAMISYSGWLQNSDTYNYYCRWIKPNVSFRYCKQLVSKKSKKRSENNDRMEDSSKQQ